MSRRVFKLGKRLREILKEDSTKPFQSRLLTDCGTTLGAMYNANKGNQHVWVYDSNGILGVIVFTDKGDEFHLDLVSNNFSVDDDILNQIRPGRRLYQALENTARLNGVSRITLESVPNRVSYWQEQFHFELTGTPVQGSFCKLYPMAKNI